MTSVIAFRSADGTNDQDLHNVATALPQGWGVEDVPDDGPSLRHLRVTTPCRCEEWIVGRQGGKFFAVPTRATSPNGEQPDEAEAIHAMRTARAVAEAILQASTAR